MQRLETAREWDGHRGDYHGHGVVLGLIGAGIKWMIELVLAQSRLTITELRDEIKELEAENAALKAGKDGVA